MVKLEWATKKIKVSNLIAFDINPRKISEDKKQKLIESLEKFNLVEIPAVNTDLQIIGGNQRVKALMLVGRGEEEIDVRFPNRELTKKEVKEYAIISNTHAGEFDFEILDLEFSDIDMQDIGFDIAGLDDWQIEKEKTLTAEAKEDDYEVPETVVETDIVLGDLFEIGEHRLLCGDSTCSDTVAKLMNGEKADMVFTSPPYNQGGGGMKYDYNGDIKKLYQQNTDKKTKREYFDFCISILNVISLISKENSAIFWNVSYNANARNDYGKIIFSDLNPFNVYETIIWDKGHAFPTASKGILSRTCEFVFLMSKQKYYTNQGDNEPIYNVWRISSNGAQNEIHKACFPIGLPTEGLKLCSKENAIIYEPFTGSGSTMVAAHQLKRKCYGMELDPKYCQVILERMIKLDPLLTIKKNGIEWKNHRKIIE